MSRKKIAFFRDKGTSVPRRQFVISVNGNISITVATHVTIASGGQGGGDVERIKKAECAAPAEARVADTKWP